MTPDELTRRLKENPDLSIDWHNDPFADVNAVLFGPPATETRPAPTSEEDAQQLIIAWADANLHRWPELAWLHHSPNGGYRHPATAARMKAMGCRRGYPDLVLPVRRGPFVGFAGELKAGKNKPTEAQMAWLAHLAREGWYCTVQWGHKAMIAEIRGYLEIEQTG